MFAKIVAIDEHNMTVLNAATASARFLRTAIAKDMVCRASMLSGYCNVHL